MRLGLKKDEVRLEPYSPEWKKEFKYVKQAIMNYTNLSEDRIQHIGSTAIDGMPSKPIIDILIGVEDLERVEQTLFNGLKLAGFLRLKVKRPGEIILAKFTDETFEVKTHFIHLTEYDSMRWKDLIFFRDYLNENECAREQYAQLKEEYVKDASIGIMGYTNYKEPFVRNVFAKRCKIAKE